MVIFVFVFQPYLYSSHVCIPALFVFQPCLYSSHVCIPVMFVFQPCLYSSHVCIPAMFVFQGRARNDRWPMNTLVNLNLRSKISPARQCWSKACSIYNSFGLLSKFKIEPCYNTQLQNAYIIALGRSAMLLLIPEKYILILGDQMCSIASYDYKPSHLIQYELL